MRETCNRFQLELADDIDVNDFELIFEDINKFATITMDHSKLDGLNKPDQHPIKAIKGLQRELDKKVSKEDLELLPVNELLMVNKTGELDSSKLKVTDVATKKYVDRPNSYALLEKVQDYLYRVVYNNIDYQYANMWFKEHYDPNEVSVGHCASIRNGNFYGRNLDWYYSNLVDFMIQVPRQKDRYASIGVAGNIAKLTEDFVSSREYDDMYKLLPFMTMDGINEHGVICSMNVVPAGDFGYTTGTLPESCTSLCMFMIPRYILDHYRTARAAVMDISHHINVYAPFKEGVHEECHFMVADATETYLMEFIYNQDKKRNVCVVTKLEDKPYITNFYLQDVEFDEDGHIDYDTVTDYGMGLERYDLITDEYSSSNTMVGMRELLNKLAYTHSYDPEEDPYWYTEFTGDYTKYGYGDLTVRTPRSEYEKIVRFSRNLFLKRNRDPKSKNYGSWQTVHASIYDIVSRTLTLTAQEGDDEFFLQLSINGVESVSKSYVDAKDAETLQKAREQGAETKIIEHQVSSSEWSITHNMNKYPSVTVVDSAGSVVIGEITYINSNQIDIKFNSEFSGKVYLN